MVSALVFAAVVAAETAGGAAFRDDSVPTAVVVSPASAEMVSLGETVRLTAEVLDQFGEVMSVAVTWSSSAAEVARVNSAGVVMAESNGGATILATAGDASGRAEVTVVQRVASISIVPAAFKLIVGGSVQASAGAADANGNAVADVAFSWASSDTAVATVSESALVNAVRVGSAFVRAASTGIESALEIDVVVPPPVRSVEIVLGPTNGGDGWGAGSWELPLEQVFATTLRAEGNPGYDFARWSEDGVTLSTDSVYPMQLAGNHKITAHFSVNPERGRWGPGNTYTDYEFPGTGYESLAWTFLPVADPPESLRQKDLLHYYAYNFSLVNSSSAIGYGMAFEPATAKIDVTPRTWNFRRMTHPPATYSVPHGANAKSWGAYATYIAERGSAVGGTGPWKGEHFMNNPIQLRGRMYLHPDFTSNGDLHLAVVDSTCSVPYSANVLTVNSVCGTVGNLNIWNSIVERHEQLHEDGANLCLVGGIAARTALADMEEITGTDRNDVMNKFNDIFTLFLNGDLDDATETTTQTRMSPKIWEWRDNGAWTLQTLQPARHAGTTGC